MLRRARVLGRVEEAWRELGRATDGLPDATLMETGVVGAWSLRDLLAHITTWEQEALKALPLVLDGKPLPRYSTLYGGIDAFNARTHQDKGTLSLDQVRREAGDSHESLVSFLETVPDEAFRSGSRFYRRLRQDTFHHYQEHATQILAWRGGR